MMIVQVINNGGVAGDQFDLLIPGGGVGALNGCATQWGVSNSDLGAQYGGFLAGCNGSTSCVQQKCQTIFGDKPDLLAGCNWFLGWFGAADNPNMVGQGDRLPADDQGARAAVAARQNTPWHPMPVGSGAHWKRAWALASTDEGREVQKRTADVTARAAPAA